MERTQGSRPAIAQTLFLLTVATLIGAPAAADGPTPRGKPVQIAMDVFDGNTPSGIFLNYPVTALTDDGSGAAAWVSEAWDNTASNIYFSRLDTKGRPLGAPSLVNCPLSEEGSYSGNAHPAVATDAAGNSVVVWFAFTESSTAVKARLFAADGTPRGNEFCVDPNCSEPTPYSYSVAMAADGRFVVAFETPFH